MGLGRITGPIDSIGDSTRDYIDNKIDEVKLRLVKEFSSFFATIFSYLIIIVLALAAIIFIAAAMGQFLGNVLGSAIGGSLIIGGAFIITSVVLVCCKKRLFIDTLVRIFINIFFGEE